MSTPKPSTIRLTDADKALINHLKQRYGIKSTADLIRLALRMLAERKV